MTAYLIPTWVRIAQQLQLQTLITHILYMHNYHSNFYLQYAKKKIMQISNIENLLNFPTDTVIYSRVLGVTVLVTHLERKPLDPVYRGLLLKQFYVDKEGQRVVKIGHREFKYHPQFALYLSTSVPLFLRGKEKKMYIKMNILFM